MLNKKTLIHLLFGCCSTGPAFGLTLTEYIQQVQTANPTLKAVQESAQGAQYQIRPASTWDDPFIAAGLDEIPFEGEMKSVRRYQISQTIPFPGKKAAQENLARYKASALKSDLETTARQLRVVATQVYLKYYLNQRALDLNLELRQLLQTIAASARASYKAGTSGHHEWLLAQVELSILDVEKLRLQREEKSLKAVVNELRNEPVQSSVGPLSFEYQEPDLASFQPLDLPSQPELQSSDFFLKQAAEEERLAKLSFFPDFVLQGMMMDPGTDNMMEEQKNWGIMLGVNIPLFFWRKQRDLLQVAYAQKRTAEWERQALLNRLSAEWLEAQEQWKTSIDVVKLYMSSVLPTTRLAVENAKSGYSARRLPLAPYLDALKVQRVQELEFLAAQMDVHLAGLRMKDLLSNPPRLRLSPGRPSLFGAGEMPSNMGPMGSETVNMGSGMSGPTRKTKSNGTKSNSGSGMEGM